MAQSSEIVQSVDRALMLLEQIAGHQGGLRLSDLAREIGLPVSTVHRLLTTLEGRRFVQMDRASGRWSIAERAHTVGSAFTHFENLIVPARPVLQRLRDATQETANLGYVSDGETITLAQAESREIMRAIAPPGGRVPVLNSGMGKAIAAWWPEEAIAALIERGGIRPMTSKSLQSREAVLADLEQIRSRGYAIDDEEYVVGMRCVAVPIWITGDEPSCALSISGLAARVTADRVTEVAGTVRELAEELGQILRGDAAEPEKATV